MRTSLLLSTALALLCINRSAFADDHQLAPAPDPDAYGTCPMAQKFNECQTALTASQSDFKVCAEQLDSCLGQDPGYSAGQIKSHQPLVSKPKPDKPATKPDTPATKPHKPADKPHAKNPAPPPANPKVDVGEHVRLTAVDSRCTKIEVLKGTNVLQTATVCNGRDGTDGTNGTNGINGTDGKNGHDGKNGQNGRNGIDGTRVSLGFGARATAIYAKGRPDAYAIAPTARLTFRLIPERLDLRIEGGYGPGNDGATILTGALDVWLLRSTTRLHTKFGLTAGFMGEWIGLDGNKAKGQMLGATPGLVLKLIDTRYVSLRADFTAFLGASGFTHAYTANPVGFESAYGFNGSLALEFNF